MQLVGTPSYRNQMVDRITLVFVAVLSIAMVAGAVWIARAIVSGESAGGGGKAIFLYVPIAVAMFMGLRGPKKRMRNATLERPVDAELGRLPENYLVFCARPWMGQTQERARSNDENDPRTWTLTDRHGRPAGSLSPDRIVLGPTGIWLVIVAPSLSSKDAIDHVADARESALALKRFLKNMTVDPSTAEQPEAVRLLFASPEDDLVADLEDGRKFKLSSLAQLIAGSPLSPLPGPSLQARAHALACCYTDGEREAAVTAIGALVRPVAPGTLG